MNIEDLFREVIPFRAEKALTQMKTADVCVLGKGGTNFNKSASAYTISRWLCDFLNKLAPWLPDNYLVLMVITNYSVLKTMNLAGDEVVHWDLT